MRRGYPGPFTDQVGRLRGAQLGSRPNSIYGSSLRWGKRRRVRWAGLLDALLEGSDPLTEVRRQVIESAGARGRNRTSNLLIESSH